MDTSERLSLPADEELDDEARALLKELPPLNIARMLARTGMAPEFYGCVRRIFDDDWFPALDREIMLFRICRQNKSDYEIHQHAAYGGVDRGLIDAIMSDDLDRLDPWQRELCRRMRSRQRPSSAHNRSRCWSRAVSNQSGLRLARHARSLPRCAIPSATSTAHPR